jgi:4-oxalocrotonate tautomerase
MPIVHIELYPGRSDTMKEHLARRIVDAVAEVAGTSRDAIDVIFHEVSKDNWAGGPRLVSHRPAGMGAKRDADAFLVVNNLHVEEDRREAYLAWRRDRVYPYMAVSEGFLSSTVVALENSKTDYLIINKWTSEAAQDAYTADPREEQLRVEAKAYMDELVTPIQSGSVIDVFHGGWKPDAVKEKVR